MDQPTFEPQHPIDRFPLDLQPCTETQQRPQPPIPKCRMLGDQLP
jgi:hypothetical protein